MRRQLLVVSFASLFGLAAAGAGYACQLFFAATAAVALPACDTTDAGPLSPVAGITVRSESLTEGYGCGKAPGQVYKYVAVVHQVARDGSFGPIASWQIYDCFADATFASLCTYGIDGGVGDFDVAVYAYNADTWATVGDAIQSRLQGDQGLFPLTCPPSYDAGPIGEPPSEGPANWTTTCIATQQVGIQVLAACNLPMTPAAVSREQ
ncbi:MAG TPA: hypothetical protein VGI39_39320 [Polyangiaceae bacterium]